MNRHPTGARGGFTSGSGEGEGEGGVKRRGYERFELLLEPELIARAIRERRQE